MKVVLILMLLFTFVWSDWVGGKYFDWKKGSCLECTHVVDDVIDSLKKTLEKDEPLRFDGGEPCKNCQISGSSTMTQVGEACIIKNPWKPGCYLQAFTIKMDFLKMTCNCSVPIRPLPFLKTLKRLIKDTPKIIFCDMKSSGPPDNYSITDHLIPKNFSQLTACIPWTIQTDLPKQVATDAKSAYGSIVGGHKMSTPSAENEQERGTATIGANWPDIEARLYIVKCPKKRPLLRKINIIKDNYNDITAECKPAHPKVAKACQCLAESDFVKIKLVTAIRNVLPCLINSKEDSLKKIVGELQCDIQSVKK